MSLDKAALPVPATKDAQTKDGFRYQKSARHFNGRNFHRNNNDGGAGQGATGSNQGAGPSGTAAAITPAASAGRAPPPAGGPSRRTAAQSRPYTHPVPELVARDVRECPVKPGPTLDDASRTILRQWGICTYCREARHPRPCPKLLEQSHKGGKRPHQ